MKKNNKGFSYVELIAVIGVMSVLVAVAALSMSLVARTNVQKAGDRMVTALNQARMNALTQGTSNGYLNLTVHNGSLYANVGKVIANSTDINMDEQKWDKISDRALTFTCGGETLAEGQVLTNPIHFSQATGGLLPASYLEMSFTHGDRECWVSVDAYTGKTLKN